MGFAGLALLSGPARLEARSALIHGAPPYCVASLACVWFALFETRWYAQFANAGVAMQSFAGGAISIVAGLLVGESTLYILARFRCDPG